VPQRDFIGAAINNICMQLNVNLRQISITIRKIIHIELTTLLSEGEPGGRGIIEVCW
jgi:hypothetical protein